MATAAPATVSSNLIDRLNGLRTRHGGGRGSELQQIRFAAQGLKRIDPAAFLAVSGMIAAIEGDVEELRKIANDLEQQYPERMIHHLNVLRSFATVRSAEDVKTIARRLADRVNDVPSALKLTDCLMVVGDIEGCVELTEAYADQWHIEADYYEDREVARELLNTGATSETVGTFLTTAFDALDRLGWPVPTITIDRPMSDLGDDDAKAIVRFMIEAEPEEILQAEDAFMDAMISAKDPLFGRGTIACSVGSWK